MNLCDVTYRVFSEEGTLTMTALHARTHIHTHVPSVVEAFLALAMQGNEILHFQFLPGGAGAGGFTLLLVPFEGDATGASSHGSHQCLFHNWSRA